MGNGLGRRFFLASFVWTATDIVSQNGGVHAGHPNSPLGRSDTPLHGKPLAN